MNKRYAEEMRLEDVKDFLQENEFYNYLEMFFNNFLKNADDISMELGISSEEFVSHMRAEADQTLDTVLSQVITRPDVPSEGMDDEAALDEEMEGDSNLLDESSEVDVMDNTEEAGKDIGPVEEDFGDGLNDPEEQAQL